MKTAQTKTEGQAALVLQRLANCLATVIPVAILFGVAQTLTQTVGVPIALWQRVLSCAVLWTAVEYYAWRKNKAD